MKLAVIGAGAWGTALAITAAQAGCAQVSLWARRAEQAEAMEFNRCNPDYLCDIALPEAVRPTGSMEQALDGVEAVLLVAPAQALRATARLMSPYCPPGLPVAICAKGIELDTLKPMSAVLSEALPQAVPAILSGPTFAQEVAQGLPTAVVCASKDTQACETIVRAIRRPVFRPYLSDDVTGVELGGAAKNVLAIACGIAAGMQLGDNARAALVTRALSELTRLILALGGKVETATGLAVMGDLVLTAGSPQSRNMSLGIALGRGETLANILAGRRGVTEGVKTAPALRALADRAGVDMPIVAAVDDVVTRGSAPEAALQDLLARPIRAEGWLREEG